MDREYLEDYEQKEHAEIERFLRRIQEGKFDFEKDKYPPDERFVNLQKPVAITNLEGANVKNIWTQVPFCGSLIFNLPSFPRFTFEKNFFKVSSIPKIIDFVKETGRLQVVIKDSPEYYEGLDFLDPFFKELSPPLATSLPYSILGNEKELRNAYASFYTLAKVQFLDHLWELTQRIASRAYRIILNALSNTYVFLKLGRYAVVEDIENLVVDDPEKAYILLDICMNFIENPIVNLRCDLMNFPLGSIKMAQALPLVYRPEEIRFPCEIGKFLLKKLTYAPQGLRACNELIDHYDAYDLRKVQESLNDAIVSNHPDIVKKSAEELSEILDNIWKDPTIPRRVKGIKIGIPLSMAAIGTSAAGSIGAVGGFLAGLGFDVLDKAIDIGAEGLSEKLAKLRTKSYQANVYDFKKKYKGKIGNQ